MTHSHLRYSLHCIFVESAYFPSPIGKNLLSSMTGWLGFGWHPTFTAGPLPKCQWTGMSATDIQTRLIFDKGLILTSKGKQRITCGQAQSPLARWTREDIVQKIVRQMVNGVTKDPLPDRMLVKGSLGLQTLVSVCTLRIKEGSLWVLIYGVLF